MNAKLDMLKLIDLCEVAGQAFSRTKWHCGDVLCGAVPVNDYDCEHEHEQEQEQERESEKVLARVHITHCACDHHSY